MPKDIPIIFSGPMVRALLDGRKTMTRRILKPQPEPFLIDRKPCEVGVVHVEGNPRPRITLGRVITKQEIRYAEGDRLWVRENWRAIHSGDPSRGAQYRADVGTDQTVWRPSIHMPRWASRLTLIVTGVKIERLQAITREDAIAEGATSRPNCIGFRDQRDGWSMDWSWVGKFSPYASGGPGPLHERDVSLGDPQSAFGEFINVVHGGERWNMPGKPVPIWDQNPFVVAISFRIIKANIDTPQARCAA